MAKPTSASYGSLPFAEQIAFFQRKITLSTEDWSQLFESSHDHAFVVAGANRDDLVTDFRIAVDKAISQGTTLEQFRKDFDQIVTKYGWDYNGGRNWRSRVIYDTNLRTSYAAGRYAQLQAVKKSRPYWQYVHSDAVEHPRVYHLAWDGLVLHADDPWWRTHFGPNGWGCQCTVHALNQRDLARLGKTGPDQAPPITTREVTVGTRGAHPRTVTVPDGIDSGFAYAPGATVRPAWLAQRAEEIFSSVATNSSGTWRALVNTTAKEIGRPEKIPLSPLPSMLGEPLTSAAQVHAELVKYLGGESRVFNVKGLPVAVDAATLSRHIDPARAEYLPLLFDMLANPFEIWTNLFQHKDTGYYEMRSAAVKAYDVGRGRGLLLVAQQRSGFFESWTLIPTGVDNYLNKQRKGMLWFGA